MGCGLGFDGSLVGVLVFILVLLFCFWVFCWLWLVLCCWVFKSCGFFGFGFWASGLDLWFVYLVLDGVLCRGFGNCLLIVVSGMVDFWFGFD